MIKRTDWSPLEPGDVVDVVAPASGAYRQEIKKIQQLLESWGLEPRLDPQIVDPKAPLMAHSDEERFRQLRQALLASDSKVIWSLRGGYGSLRLLPLLAKMKRPKRPKLFLGYSDITSLHSFFGQSWGWSTWHAPGLESLSQRHVQSRVQKEIKELLFGLKRQMDFLGLKPMNSKARALKRIQAPVVGGNMAVIQSSLGTPWALRAQGKILFFEDIGEKAHRVDRMLTQMSQAGFFSGVRAVLFGGLSLSDSRGEKLIWKTAIQDFTQANKVAVFRGLEVGHVSVNRPLPLNTPAQLLQMGKQNFALRLSLKERRS